MKILWACMSILLVACSAHVSSSLQVDGARFSPTTCRSGQANGFAGVELADEQGQRLRLAHLLDGSFQALYFPSGSETGENLGACGTMSTREGGAVINGIRNLDGSAALDCGSSKYKVTGSVRFEGCH